jgi:hypothetical protein
VSAPTITGLDARIIKAAIKGILDAGCVISVFDGEEVTVRRSADADAIFAALGTTDEDTLLVLLDSSTKSRWQQIGSVYLVYGNEAGVVICDTRGDVDHMLYAANALAEGGAK